MSKSNFFKKMNFSLLVLFISIVSGTLTAASASPSPTRKEHRFVYRTADSTPAGSFEFSSTAPTYEEAYEKAALACYRHFRDYLKTKNSQKNLNEDQGLDIIDVCANPRSI